ncbi:MAG TPA: hypothetical protein VFU12_08970 [Glycomyces sp.]|nr:hypothetical protein [Glycomyces sp.]
MSGRVVPYQCPYCGEADLRPYEPAEDDAVRPDEAKFRGAWHCRDCTRVFTVKFHGMAAPRMMAAPPSPPAAAAHHPGGEPPPDPESE